MRSRMAALVAAVLPVWASAAGAAEIDRITINGYTSFEFEKQLDSEGEGDPNGSFDADMFDLVLNIQVSDRIRAATDLTWEHGAATEDGYGNVAIEYGFIEYAVADVLRFRVGKMFTPFGIFNEIHTAKPAFLSVKEPSSTNKTERIVEGAFRFFPRWGAGIALQGDGVIGGRNFDYDVLFANGAQEGANPYEEDLNTAKSVTARFRLEPSDTVQIGTSFYYDKLAEAGLDRIVSDGIELRFQRKEVTVLAEVVVGWRRPVAGDSVTQVGWFIQPSYQFENGISPYARLERIDPDTGVEDDHGYDFIVGVNFEISAGFMVKLEDNYFKGARGSSLARFPGRGYNELKTAVVLGF